MMIKTEDDLPIVLKDLFKRDKVELNVVIDNSPFIEPAISLYIKNNNIFKIRLCNMKKEHYYYLYRVEILAALLNKNSSFLFFDLLRTSDDKIKNVGIWFSPLFLYQVKNLTRTQLEVFITSKDFKDNKIVDILNDVTYNYFLSIHDKKLEFKFLQARYIYYSFFCKSIIDYDKISEIFLADNEINDFFDNLPRVITFCY
jgi:hypothetical protein